MLLNLHLTISSLKNCFQMERPPVRHISKPWDEYMQILIIHQKTILAVLGGVLVVVGITTICILSSGGETRSLESGNALYVTTTVESIIPITTPVTEEPKVPTDPSTAIPPVPVSVPGPDPTNVTATTAATLEPSSNTTNASNTDSLSTPSPTPEGQIVTLYSYSNFKYPAHDARLLKDCVNLPGEWQKRVSSVNTNGNCIDICPFKDCTGNCMTLAPGTLGHNRLRDINFDKRIVSLRLCPK